MREILTIFFNENVCIIIATFLAVLHQRFHRLREFFFAPSVRSNDFVLLNSSFNSKNNDGLLDPLDASTCDEFEDQSYLRCWSYVFLMDSPAAESSPPTVASAEINCDPETLCLSRITLSVTKSSTAERMWSLEISFYDTKASSILSFALCLFPCSKVLLYKTWRSRMKIFNCCLKN